MAKKENTIPTIIDTPEALTAKIAAMKEAQKIFATFTQEQVDKIFKAAATAADKARIPLAKDAVEETGMGIVEDKVIKNHYAAEYVYNAYKNTRTCGGGINLQSAGESSIHFGVKAELDRLRAAEIKFPGRGRRHDHR